LTSEILFFSTQEVDWVVASATLLVRHT
jgi:hypothetical protein